MRRRVEDTLDLLGLQELRDRSLRALSGGQQQRVAIGAVVTASPRVLVLDEPTSALDPAAAEEVLNALARLVHDLGLTVVMAEHRLERVLPFADRIVLVRGGGLPLEVGPPQSIMRSAPVAPPLDRTGSESWLGSASAHRARRPAVGARPSCPYCHQESRLAPMLTRCDSGEVVAAAQQLAVHYGPQVALGAVDLAVRAGEITVLMGRNGSGKCSLLTALSGDARQPAARCAWADEDPEADELS